MAYLWIILIVNAHIDSTQPVLQIYTSPEELEAVTELGQVLQRNKPIKCLYLACSYCFDKLALSIKFPYLLHLHQGVLQLHQQTLNVLILLTLQNNYNFYLHVHVLCINCPWQSFKTYSFIVAMTQNCYFKQFKAI